MKLDLNVRKFDSCVDCKSMINLWRLEGLYTVDKNTDRPIFKYVLTARCSKCFKTTTFTRHIQLEKRET